MGDYPRWRYYPTSSSPPAWVSELVAVFEAVQGDIDSASVQGEGSDGILASMTPGLVQLGYQVELSKKAIDKIERPVLFADQGKPRVQYQIDAWSPELGIVLEVEAGRGWMGNAFYRDLIRTSLIVGARYLAVGVMNRYSYKSGGNSSRATITRTPETSWTRFMAVVEYNCPLKASFSSGISDVDRCPTLENKLGSL